MKSSGYIPEIQELFKQASKREIRLEMSQSEAHSFRFKCHALRKQMRKDGHFMTETAEKVCFSIRDIPGKPGRVHLIAAPRFSEYLDALHKAGINPELGDQEEDLTRREQEALEELESNEAIEETKASRALDAFLKEDKNGS